MIDGADSHRTRCRIRDRAQHKLVSRAMATSRSKRQFDALRVDCPGVDDHHFRLRIRIGIAAPDSRKSRPPPSWHVANVGAGDTGRRYGSGNSDLAQHDVAGSRVASASERCFFGAMVTIAPNRIELDVKARLDQLRSRAAAAEFLSRRVTVGIGRARSQSICRHMTGVG